MRVEIGLNALTSMCIDVMTLVSASPAISLIQRKLPTEKAKSLNVIFFFEELEDVLYSAGVVD